MPLSSPALHNELFRKSDYISNWYKLYLAFSKDLTFLIVCSSFTGMTLTIELIGSGYLTPSMRRAHHFNCLTADCSSSRQEKFSHFDWHKTTSLDSTYPVKMVLSLARYTVIHSPSYFGICSFDMINSFALWRICLVFTDWTNRPGDYGVPSGIWRIVMRFKLIKIHKTSEDHVRSLPLLGLNNRRNLFDQLHLASFKKELSIPKGFLCSECYPSASPLEVKWTILHRSSLLEWNGESIDLLGDTLIDDS